MSKKEYMDNRERVYDIYGIEEEKRSKTWNAHHVCPKSRGGSDEKANLFPVPKKLHRLFHREGTDNELIHDYCELEFNGDPYERK